MKGFISREEQRLVIEKLYRSTDAITSTKKFNAQYQDQLGKMGDGSMHLTEFARKMRKTHFSEVYIERFIKEVTGQEIDLDTA